MSVITVDGPSGVGKGTLAMALTDWLGFDFLDSGALYRLVALQAVRQQVELENEKALAEVAAHLPVRFVAKKHGVQVILEGEDVSDEIRTEAIASLASQLAALPAVRTALLARQRAFDQGNGLIADGRDMGTVVFPDAVLKIFLTANAKERAKRRFHQLQAKGDNVTMDNVLRDIEARDRRDQQRTASPLQPATDAVVIDSSNLLVDQVVMEVKQLVEQREIRKSKKSG